MIMGAAWIKIRPRLRRIYRSGSQRQDAPKPLRQVRTVRILTFDGDWFEIIDYAEAPRD